MGPRAGAATESRFNRVRDPARFSEDTRDALNFDISAASPTSNQFPANFPDPRVPPRHPRDISTFSFSRNRHSDSRDTFRSITR